MTVAGRVSEHQAAIRYALNILHDPSEVFEVRIPGSARGTVSGYFDEPGAAAAEIARWDGRVPGVYATLNPVSRSLPVEDANRLREYARETTCDKDVETHRWLPVDVDSERSAAASSATDGELRATWNVAWRVRVYLLRLGWPEPLIVFSGNGWHLLYRVELPAGAETRRLLERVLTALDEKFQDESATIDTVVFNPARLLKVPGTMACKGESTPARPHRRSRLEYVPDQLTPVAKGLLARVAAAVAPPPPPAESRTDLPPFDLEGFMSRNGLRIRKHKREAGRELWELAECPFNPEHNRGEAWIQRLASGSISAGCHHEHCFSTWAELRERFEPRTEVITESFPFEDRTDAGNASLFVRLNAGRVRYVPAWGWLYYDGTRWRRDCSLYVEHLMREALLTLFDKAAEAQTTADSAKLAKWAVTSRSAQRLAAALQVARSDRRITALPEDFDRDRWLFNCRDGVIDLRTGELRRHAPEDMLTRLAPVSFDPTATSDLWERVLSEVTGGDEQLRAGLQRALGYCISGSTREETAFLATGPTASGKSTLFEAVKATMGDYALAANPETFLARSHVGGPRDDIAAMEGARLVVCAEFDRGRRMAEALLKQLAGGDTVRARQLYRSAREFAFTAKIVMHTNYTPAMRDDDDAVWRRLRVLPFRHTIPEERRDPSVKARLCDSEESGPAILAWLVQGCLSWQLEGLGKPAAIIKATQDVRSSMDPLAGFFDDCCALEAGVWTSSAQLREAYQHWCRENRAKPVGLPEWGRRLGDRGLRSEKQDRMRGWRGVRLLDAETVTTSFDLAPQDPAQAPGTEAGTEDRLGDGKGV